MTASSLATIPNKTALIAALRDSLYPGAKDESIEMVLSYCQAGGYDPMTKPVHIVPMWDKNAKTMRDTVMPGIVLYRIIAERSGKYAGQDEAEFGPVMEHWGVQFPRWCKVTVWKITPVGRVAYSAKVFWLEAYAVASKDSDAPNTMWKKRPFGQLEKCAEAAALRKAFPEIGAQPTEDEMPPAEFVDDPVQAMPPPKTRAAALKERLKPETPPADVDPETGEVIDPIAGLLEAINKAESPDDLKACRDAVAALKNGERRRAVEAWKTREKALMPAPDPA